MAAGRSEAVALVRLGRKAASAYGRPDLADRLDVLAERLERRRTTIVVLGEYKAGKSSLVNVLVSADVCPVDVDVATAVPTIVEHALEPSVVVIGLEPAGQVSEREVPPADAAGWIRGEHGAAVGVRVGLPRPLLADGFVIVDTPGVGGLDARHVAQSLSVLSSADMVLFAADGADELGGPALELLALVQGLAPVTALVLTKADLYHHVDEVAAADREHLRLARLDIPVHVVSAELRARSVVAADRSLDEESGLPELVSTLRRLRADTVHRAALAAATAVEDVARQLHEVFSAELAAIVSDAAGAPAPLHAPAVTPGSWQQLLGDEIADFSSDLDFELRRRSRDLLAEAESALGEGDPDEVWPEVTAWLTERAAADVVATFSSLRTRTALIATRVAERFDLSGEGNAPVDPVALDELVHEVIASLPERAAIGAMAKNRTTSGLNAFRSTFYAFTMFSTVGALVGFAAAPVALVLGLVVGGKSVRDERARSQQQRRTQAKAALRTYLDEVALVAGKESRDALRLVQRGLRDHFGALAAQRQRTSAEAAAAVRRAVVTDREARARRRADVEAELGRLDELLRRAKAVVAGLRGGSN